MISIPAGARILLAIRPVDFRKGAHTLAALAQEALGEDPFSGAVIVYRAKRSDRIKILVWDTSGLVLIWNYVASHCISFRCRLAFWFGVWEEGAALSARRSHRLECFTGRLFSGSS